MRENSTQTKIKTFMGLLGKRISQPITVYFTGGATAVLLGFRTSTIDVDLKFEPDLQEMYQAIRHIKEEFNMNIELASPDHFVPPLPGWKERNIFIEKTGQVSFYHYDLYTQVLAKIERGWEVDLQDAKNFVRHSVEVDTLMKFFYQAQEDFIRYPSIEPKKLEQKLVKFKNEIIERQ